MAEGFVAWAGLLDVIAVRPVLCLAGLGLMMWLYRIWPLRSLQVLLLITVVSTVLDGVGQLVDAGVLVMGADERMKLYYGWGWLSVIAVPFTISYLRSLSELIHGRTQEIGSSDESESQPY